MFDVRINKYTLHCFKCLWVYKHEQVPLFEYKNTFTHTKRVFVSAIIYEYRAPLKPGQTISQRKKNPKQQCG